MNLLTKEECEKAYTDFEISREVLRRALESNCELMNPIPIFDKATMIFARLIHEHFLNPPLKFEELKEGMLVYDKVRGSWAEIDKTVDKTHDGVQNVVFCWVIGWDIQKIIEYRPNRFYRKEVKDVD